MSKVRSLGTCSSGNNTDYTIEKVVERGRGSPVCNELKLYSPSLELPIQQTKMTREFRKAFNDMSVYLNKAIEDAVSKSNRQGVKWIPIDGQTEGRRYYEPGDNTVDKALQKAFDNVTAGVDTKTAFKTYSDLENAVFGAAESDGGSDTKDVRDSLFRTIAMYISDSKNEKTPDPKPAPAKDRNACHGVSGYYWVMSRDTAVDNAKAFCQQTDKKVTYNSGSVSELGLSARKLDDDSKGPADAPGCLGRFQHAVIDGCGGDDAVNNPHSYNKQVNEVGRDVSYMFLFDLFEIRSENLPDAKVAADGRGLKKELSGCGAPMKWNFETTPTTSGFQWYASGHLPIGTKDCVGDALVTTGGSGERNCGGGGKRVRRRPIGIEDRPGYGDEGRHAFKSPAAVRRVSIDAWPGHGDADKHVFKHPASDAERKGVRDTRRASSDPLVDVENGT
ncbi:hypothetical protein F4818DRAFT_441885 [Hypoxylon cercidicola]|nr:hypothetical protein F4818DRAFT_441885 [Hypoxylon cercidicola]